MASRLDTAVSLGRTCFNMDTFVEGCDHCNDRQLAGRLKEVGLRLNTLLQNEEAREEYKMYVRDHLLPDTLTCAFYMQQPMDNFLIHIHGVERMRKAANVYPFLSCLLDYGASEERMTCALLPNLETLAFDTPFIDEMCALLHRLGRDEKAQRMLSSHRLLNNLSYRFSKSCASHIVGMIVQSKMYEDAVLVYPIVQCCVKLLYREASFMNRVQRLAGDEHLSAALDLLVHSTSNTRTNSLFIPDVIHLSRPGWMTRYGRLVCNMLQGTSVQFVIELHRAGKLTSLWEKACAVQQEEDEHAAWTSIRRMLQEHLPSLARREEIATTAAICPITLHPMVRPVVASDGHTYEREALMRHLMQNGMFSPITKQALDYSLYSNRYCME